MLLRSSSSGSMRSVNSRGWSAAPAPSAMNAISDGPVLRLGAQGEGRGRRMRADPGPGAAMAGQQEDPLSASLPPRSRKVKILATLGPASSDPKMIRALMEAGADAFRVNMSHGDQKAKIALFEAIRALEKEFRRPTTILV